MNIINEKENFDKPRKNFIMLDIYKSYKQPEKTKNYINHDKIYSHDDAVFAIIKTCSQCERFIFELEVVVDIPYFLASWSDLDILSYIRKISRVCAEFLENHYLVSQCFNESPEVIFNQGIQDIETWLLEIKNKWFKYLYDYDNQKREIGFR